MPNGKKSGMHKMANGTWMKDSEMMMKPPKGHGPGMAKRKTVKRKK